MTKLAAVVGAVVLTGHRCTTVTTIEEGSTKVFIGGKGVVRKDDAALEHTHKLRVTDTCLSHTPKVNQNSTKVYVDGKGVARKDDGLSDGSFTYSGEKIRNAKQTKVYIT
jgi:hypothetical protein